MAFHPIVETADEDHLVVPHALPWSPYRPTLARAGLRSAWAALGVIQGRRVRLRPCRAAGRPQTSDGFGWRRLESEGRNDRAWSAPPRARLLSGPNGSKRGALGAIRADARARAGTTRRCRGRLWSTRCSTVPCQMAPRAGPARAPPGCTARTPSKSICIYLYISVYICIYPCLRRLRRHGRWQSTRSATSSCISSRSTSTLSASRGGRAHICLSLSVCVCVNVCDSVCVCVCV